jgi:hypothetical protein
MTDGPSGGLFETPDILALESRFEGAMGATLTRRIQDL